MKNEEKNILIEVLKSYPNWAGFTDLSLPVYKKPTIYEKKLALCYPAVRSAIKLLYLPLLAAKVSIEGQNEQQNNFLRIWFHKFFRKITQQLIKKGITWGFTAGEKIYSPIEIEGKTFLMVKSCILPEPYAITLKFKQEPFEIEGFEWNKYFVSRDKMIYYVREGDEISMPYGISILDDMWWAIEMLLKDWTLFQIYKKFKAIPFMKIFYIPDVRIDATGNRLDEGLEKAKQIIENLKEASGVALPKYETADGKWETGWEIEEVKMTEKTEAFLESIQKLESLLFLAALIPKRIIEQDMQVGTYALVKEQSDFYVEFTLQSMLEEFEEYLRNWLIFPMLQVNFGSIEVDFNLNFGDRVLELYMNIARDLIKQGFMSVDTNKIAQMLGIPIPKQEVEQREIETERKASKEYTFQEKIDTRQKAIKLLKEKSKE